MPPPTANNPDGTLRVFLDELPWDLRRHNTDGRYVRESLPQIARFQPDLRLIPQRSPWLGLTGNAKVIGAALQRRLRHTPSLASELTGHLAARELAHSGAEVVFSHRAFPLNAGHVPVIWQQAILDPAMQLSFGATEAALAEEREVKGKLFRRAAFIQLSTEAEARRHAALFPDIADRFVAIPFFTPHIEPCPPESLSRHFDTGPIKLLFVGGQAWRKGLDLLLDAFAALPTSLRNQATLTIVSNLDRSKIHVPAGDHITLLQGADTNRVLAEMRQSHIFINVARFESYGLVFHEAMSQGLACLAPDWEVQRELFDDGRAGKLLPPTAEAIRTALEDLIPNAAARHTLGKAAWTRFRERYAPAIVAKQYADFFRHAARA